MTVQFPRQRGNPAEWSITDDALEAILCEVDVGLLLSAEPESDIASSIESLLNVISCFS
jgi:hypothetical protein